MEQRFWDVWVCDHVKSASGDSHHTWNFLTLRKAAKPGAQRSGHEPGAETHFQRKNLSADKYASPPPPPPFYFKGYDKWQGRSGHLHTRSRRVRSRRHKAIRSKSREKKPEDLLLASFLALALDLILSACRFLSSSSVSPEAATTLSSSHQHCQLGHLRTCAQAIQSDTLAGAKKLSNVFIIIITFFVLSSPL